jgi:hypothetical protein
MVQVAMLERRIESLSGWPLRITHSPNQRTLYNFPMQSGGADMTRLATVRLCNAGIVPIMLIHDGILFEETEPEKIAEAMEIMRGTGRDICDGFEIGVDIDQRLENGARLSRQATNGAKDVEHHHGSPADDRRVAREDCRMSNPRLVTAHGRQILVETLETPDMPTRGRKTKKQEEFAIVPLRWMAEATKTTDTGGAMVLVLLRYLAWKNESSTFSLSNAMFTRYGIARETKRRVLRKLEAAGRLKIERGPGRALIVTLLRVS